MFPGVAGQSTRSWRRETTRVQETRNQRQRQTNVCLTEAPIDSVIWNCYIIHCCCFFQCCCTFRAKFLLFFFSARCCITIDQSIFCSSQWAGWVRLWASQSDVLEGGTSATTQVRPLRHQLLFLSVHHTNVFHQYSKQSGCIFTCSFFLPVNLDIWRKWVIQTPSWTCGLSACAHCSGGAAPKLTDLRPVKPVPSQSPEQVESRCWSDRSRNKSRGETVEADAEE